MKCFIKEEIRVLHGKAGKLNVYCACNSGAMDRNVLVVPNGYGLLFYCKELGKALSKHYSNVIIPELRGQGGSEGLLSIKGAAQDLKDIILYIYKQRDKKIDAIVHCSAAFYLFEIDDDDFWDKISKIILYGYLANPQKHLSRFKRKAKNYGIRIAKDLGDLTKYTVEMYDEIPVPLHIIHPLAGINALRANKNELDILGQNAKNLKIRIPSVSYEIENTSQKENISMIVDKYYCDIIESSE